MISGLPTFYLIMLHACSHKAVSSERIDAFFFIWFVFGIRISFSFQIVCHFLIFVTCHWKERLVNSFVLVLVNLFRVVFWSQPLGVDLLEVFFSMGCAENKIDFVVIASFQISLLIDVCVFLFIWKFQKPI